MNFFTATINSWKHLLKEDDMKQIIIDSLIWLDKEEKAFTHGFVIMPNHVHFLWSHIDVKYDIELAFLSFTGHAFKKKLKQGAPGLLEDYTSTQADRKYHFWERRSRTIETKSRRIVVQKLDYTHNNPLQDHWNLAHTPEEYRYSSARYYMQMENEFNFLKHYIDYS